MIHTGQTQAFQEQKIELSKKISWKKNSAISRLDPFMDSDGLLCLGGYQASHNITQNQPRDFLID